MAPPAIESRDDGVLLRVRVQPKASRNRIVEACDGYYRVSLTAPPVDGAANTALVAFLAKTLGVRKGQIELCTGKQSRTKALRVSGAKAASVQHTLDKAMAT